MGKPGQDKYTHTDMMYPLIHPIVHPPARLAAVHSPLMNTEPPKRRFYSDGRAIWYIDRIWPLAAGLPQEDLPIDQVRELDEVTWFSETWGVRPTCRLVIEHCRRILDADMSYPVILGPGGFVLDGIHRIAKAMIEGRTSVRAVRILAMPPPDETLSPSDPRYEAPKTDA